MKPFTLTVATLSAACYAFDRWLWKSPIFQGWLVQRPDLQGSWKATLTSDWTDRPGSPPAPAIHCMMVIRQTFSTFSARLITAQSNSSLTAHNIIRQNDGVFQVAGIYHNTPTIALRGKRSEIHNGAFILEVHGDPPTSITGHYWTDRDSKGALSLSDHTPELLVTYEQAVRQFRLPIAAVTNA